MHNITAIERLKMFGALSAIQAGRFQLDKPAPLFEPADLQGFVLAKAFDQKVITNLAERDYFAEPLLSLVLRTYAGVDDYFDDIAKELNKHRWSGTAYSGSYDENRRIDACIANSGNAIDEIRFGQGSATGYYVNSILPTEIEDVPIAIIGYGAAGILAARALREVGFTEIKVFEKSRDSLGIWGQENVSGLSRNNPSRLQFFEQELKPAPGGGDEVREFLEIAATFSYKIRKVVKVTPGKLNHQLTFENGETRRFPIVIIATGLGKPKQVSDPSKMVTDTGAAHAGHRWQLKLDPEKVRGKRIILNGLGNSTAEMLRQLHTLQDEGMQLDYQVITHYPEDAVYDPSRYVSKEGKLWRVFRDLSLPNLVDFQGDLQASRQDYFRALHSGRIISEVRRWEVNEPGKLELYRHGNELLQRLAYGKIMTLIGYRQPEEAYRALGCAYDTVNQCGIFDYDGEVVANPGETDARKRLHKGCYGFGSILESPADPNAVVIPGMLYRLGDLVFGVIMRAAEVRKKQLLSK